MSDVQTIPKGLQPLIPAAEAVLGRRLALSTLLRWATKPRKGVLLQSWVVGGTRCTTVAAVEQYIREMTEASTPTMVKPSRTQRQREQAIARAERTIASLAKK